MADSYAQAFVAQQAAVRDAPIVAVIAAILSTRRDGVYSDAELIEDARSLLEAARQT